MNLEMLKKDIRARQAVLGFSGWPDAGRTVHPTLSEMKRQLVCEEIAVWDMDGFWHSEAMRPQVTVQQGHIRRLDWPEWRFSLCGRSSSDPILVGMGPEPGYRWRTFTREILQLLDDCGCQEVILLGSLFDQVLHDEVVISCVVQDILGFNRARELGCELVEYAGSSAIHSAIMEAAQESNVHCLSLWAHLPFYIDGPHNLIMVRLLQILGTLFDFEFDTRALLEDWKNRKKEIEDSIRQDQDLNQMLESLKKEGRAARVPSSTSKVVRLEEFLQKKRRPPPGVE